MSSQLEFTGERFLPGAPGDIAYEHWHRYAFALRFAEGRRVLDAACGEGYGTALLAKVASGAVGLDVDPAAVDHARAAYADRSNLRFESGSVTAIPLPDASVDIVVSFETIEHLPADEQPRMLAEFARVLAPGGRLVISSPNRKRYSDDRGYSNPFHLHELYRDDFARLLETGFAHQRWFHQAPLVASAVWGDGPGGSAESWTGDGYDATAMAAPEAMYFIVVAALTGETIAEPLPALSVFVDRDDSELKRAEANAGEVLRLDRLLRESNETVARQADHVRHLEALVTDRERHVEERDSRLVACNAQLAARDGQLAEREGQLAERDAQLAASDARLVELNAAHALLEQDRRRQESALAAQERLLAYRQSLRGWLRWPAMRIKLWWRRWTDT